LATVCITSSSDHVLHSQCNVGVAIRYPAPIQEPCTPMSVRPPEMIFKESNADSYDFDRHSRSDIWSLGCSVRLLFSLSWYPSVSFPAIALRYTKLSLVSLSSTQLAARNPSFARWLNFLDRYHITGTTLWTRSLTQKRAVRPFLVEAR
jgi:hypothetical protein